MTTPRTPIDDNPDPHAPVTLADAIERYENSGGFECSFPEECIEPLLAIAQAFMEQRKQPDPHGECRQEIERLQQFEIAYNVWMEKTEWVQDKTDWAFPALGLHRADVMTKEINRLMMKLAEAHHLLDMAMCDVIPRSGLACEIEAFLADKSSGVTD